MKHLILVLTACAALFAVACGGSSSSSAPPPPANTGFSNSSLNGQYAFEMSGEDLNGRFIARVGSFTANGSGTITAAVEDVNDAGSFNTVQFTGGSYAIGSDGRGTLTFTGSSLNGAALGLNIALSSTKNGLAVQTDGNATSSGSFDLQTASAFSLPSITGQYAFDLSGQNLTTGAPVAIAGEFAANGTGGLTSGMMDVNDGSNTGPTNSAIPPATFTMDTTFGASDGRGTVSINGQAVAFYVVDGTRFRFLEEDTNAVTVGDAFAQTGTIPTQAANLTGNFAFISAGGAVLGNFGSIARVGSAAFNAGAISNAFLDDNNAGKHTALGPDSGSYTIDAAGSGRGTFTFTDSTQASPFTYIFYLFSPTQALLLETSTGVIASGSMSAQPASISTAGLAGNYVFNWSGATIPSSGNIGFEEDFVGQYALTSSGSITGITDFTELGSTSTPIFTGAGLTGMFNAGTTGRNTYQATVKPGNGAPASTINFAAYVAEGNTIYLVTTDSTRVTAGTAIPQTTP